MSNGLAACSNAPNFNITSCPSSARTYFFVTGASVPELLPRLINPFVKLGLTPYRVHASSEAGAGEEMLIELRFLGLVSDMAETLAARCRAIIGVHSVMLVRAG